MQLANEDSPWNAPEIKPERIGVYETHFRDAQRPIYRRWKGVYWNEPAPTVEGALQNKHFQSETQELWWRELPPADGPRWR